MPRTTIAQLTAQLAEAHALLAAAANAETPKDASSYLAGASLYRVVLPPRDERGEARFGVYVRSGFVIQAPPIARWMIGKSWDESIVPWLQSKNAKGRQLAAGERLEL